MINLDSRQSGQANDSASIVKHTKEKDFAIVKCRSGAKGQIELPQFGLEKFPVYLRVPWIGKLSTNLKKSHITAVEDCYGFITTHSVFASKCMLSVAVRMFYLPLRPTTLSVIYEYKCHCDSWHIKATSQ